MTNVLTNPLELPVNSKVSTLHFWRKYRQAQSYQLSAPRQIIRKLKGFWRAEPRMRPGYGVEALQRGSARLSQVSFP